MKYMGSKRHMLTNGLGAMIREEANSCSRFVDLFLGSGAVINYAAANTNLQPIATDLQKYSEILANAVIKRDAPIVDMAPFHRWINHSLEHARKNKAWSLAKKISESSIFSVLTVENARKLGTEFNSRGPVFNAYAGHYFSPEQALTIDYLLKYLPEEDPYRTVAHAAIIQSASVCVTAPGHTAQPFNPHNEAGLKSIRGGWDIDICVNVVKRINEISLMHSNIKGKALVMDALDFLPLLKHDDLVFVDPPYTKVHYSRFYHVLETIARNEKFKVDGVGRYPALENRPLSSFSKKTTITQSIKKLLEGIRNAEARCIFTFPAQLASNGLSGNDILEEAKTMFECKTEIVRKKFSTLGGYAKSKTDDNRHGAPRPAKQDVGELIILMYPK